MNEITTRDQSDGLYACSALTWVGLDTSPGSLQEVIDWMAGLGVDTTQAVFNVTTGGTMNRIYGLRGDNAYPTGLNIVSVTGIDVRKLILPRFAVDGRWFDDIVDNNTLNHDEDDEDDET
jgi:hypothetical protein